MTTYVLDGVEFDDQSDECQSLLHRAHEARLRPLCLCVDSNDRPQMYVAYIGERYFVKRMPETGGHHAPHCESYEPPAGLSGLAEVLGSAIQADARTGVTSLRLDFALRKLGSRDAASGGSGESDSVKSESSKLSLRALLHYLWDKAGLTCWNPIVAGVRPWSCVQQDLIGASAGVRVGNRPLIEKLFVPEEFRSARHHEIASRRAAMLAPQHGRNGTSPKASAGHELRLLIGEVKEFERASSRATTICRALVEHLPDFPFVFPEEMNKRLQKRFAQELGVWDAVPDVKLIAIATFGVGNAGVATLEEMAVMLVDRHWLPFETIYEKSLIDLLIEGRRKFKKSLRYNVASSRPMATAVLSDTGKRPVALYIVPPTADEAFDEALEQLKHDSGADSWTWSLTDGSHQPLPSKVAS